MSTTEFLVAIVGLYSGYWIVSKLFMVKPKERLAPEDKSAPPPDQNREDIISEPIWYEILNVPHDAEAADIQQSYRTLMSQYHPDKVANLGDELKVVAERKSKEINVAYEQAMRQRRERI